jgi:hypothetical protein
MRYWLPAALWMGIAPASAETALEVQSWCTQVASAPIKTNGYISIEPTFEGGFCWGAFAAIQGLNDNVSVNNKSIICAPDSSTRAQIIRIFMKYCEQHPERMHEDFVVVALTAISMAFRCHASN